jgi:hypothetical protein
VLLAAGIPNPGYLDHGSGGLRRANTLATSRYLESREAEEKVRGRVRQSDPVRYPSRFREFEGERRGSEVEKAQRPSREVVEAAKMERNHRYEYEEDDMDDDDEFVLDEDLYANARQPEPTRSVPEPEEPWECVAREERLPMGAPAGEAYSDSDYEDEDDHDEFVAVERVPI